MKRILVFWLAAMLIVVQPCCAVVMVGFGQSGGTTYTSIFSDNFNRTDSGTVGGGWNTEVDTGSLLSVTSNALVWAGSGVNTSGYVSKDTGTALNKYKVTAKVKLDTLTFPSTNAAQILTVRTASAAAISVFIKATTTTVNSIYIQVVKEDASIIQGAYPFTWVAGTAHNVELVVSTATATDSNDGTVEVIIDGTSVYSASGLDTYSKGGRIFRVGMIYADLAFTKTITIDDVDILEGD